MERIARGTLVVNMMMVMSVSAFTLLVSLVVEADDHDPIQYFSPYPSHSQILSSLASNSSEDINIRSFIHKTKKGGIEILHKVKETVGLFFHPKNKVGLSIGYISPDIPRKVDNPNSVEGNSKISNDSNHVNNVTYSFHLIEGEHDKHVMEDYVVAETRKIDEHEVGLFAIFDGYKSSLIPEYLQSHLLNNIITEPDFWREPENAMKGAYLITDANILMKFSGGLRGSTAVTAILMNDHGQLKLVVANVGDARAVICCNNGLAKQLSVDHVPNNVTERQAVEKRGGYVTGGSDPNVGMQVSKRNDPRWQVPLTRAFGIRFLKEYISCEPNVVVEMINDEKEFLVLASHPLWKVMSNQEAVDFIRPKKNVREAAKYLTQQALTMSNSTYNDISCVVVRFR